MKLPNRIIKETILTSPNFNTLSVQAERHFYRVLLLVDDHGCYEATPAVVKGRCYPLKNTSISQVEKWEAELEERGIIKHWTDSGRIYAVFVNFDKHNAKYCVTDEGKVTRHRRRTPEPPEELLASLCQDLPNLKHNLNLNPKPKPTHQELFDFWTSFEDLPGRKIAEETKSGINARLEDEYTVEEIKTAIENYVKSTEEWVVKHRKQKGWTLGQFLSRYEGKNLERFKEPLMAEGNGSVNGLDVKRETKEPMKNGSIVDGIKYVDDGEGGLRPE